MTIQEYMRLAINGIPNADYKYYLPFFFNMDCEYCIYNGGSCKHPETDDVCIEYRVESEELKRKRKL
jgi:hypothetical protein